jgi:hypothetical protein
LSHLHTSQVVLRVPTSQSGTLPSLERAEHRNNVHHALLARTNPQPTLKVNVKLAQELLQPRVVAQQIATTVSVQKVIIIPPRGQASQVSDVKHAALVPIKTWSVIKQHAVPAVQGHIHREQLRVVIPVVWVNTAQREQMVAPYVLKESFNPQREQMVAPYVLKDRINPIMVQASVDLVIRGNITTTKEVVLGLTVKLVDMAESAKLDLLYAPHVQQVQAL